MKQSDMATAQIPHQGSLHKEGPLMILSSGKVIGNVGEQWKEVQDNRNKNKAGVTSEGNQITGKELVPVTNGDNGQIQTSKEAVPVVKMQTSNKFVVLEVDDGDTNESNQIALVVATKNQSNTIQNDTASWSLNAAAPAFNPNGIAASTDVNNDKSFGNKNGESLVAAQDGMSKDFDRTLITGGRVWSQQTEEDALCAESKNIRCSNTFESLNNDQEDVECIVQ